MNVMAPRPVHRKERLRIGLLGCGRIALRHGELLGKRQIDDACLAAVCDIQPERAAAFAQKHDVPAFDSLEAMLAGADLDAVAVLTPSGMHADHAVSILRARKHAIVEKPMALTLADADRMVAAAHEANRHLLVVKQNRFNVPVVKAREALDAGRFGQLVLGSVRVRWCRDQKYYDQDGWRGTWAMDGGVVANQASHHVDMLQWFMGPVQSVHARSLRALVDIEAEDTAVATVRFRNGAVGVIEATGATRPKDLEGSLSILGSGGSVEIGGFAVNEIRHWHFVEARKEDAQVLTRYSVNPPNVYGFGHHAYYDHVVAVLRGREEPLVDGAEGRSSFELVAAIYESMASNREVSLPLRVEHSRLGKA
jgi:UDP-N-acetyl-2-amino-2-deoxyglucuronate dehydrogenase